MPQRPGTYFGTISAFEEKYYGSDVPSSLDLLNSLTLHAAEAPYE